VTTSVGAIDDQHADYVANLPCYRDGLRAYLRDADWTTEWRSTTFSSVEDEITHDAAILGRLYESGWSRYGWPTEAGGLGGTALHRGVYYEELAHALLPAPAQHWTLEVLGPVLLKYAPQIASHYLPRYLRGREWWGQCFSEPESGSDLATLRTRATDDGPNGFVLHGHKIWTSQGPSAARFLVLARTGTPESRHRGLTTFLVDSNTPGVIVRPISLASGRRELAEVFFDTVRVPRNRVVGDVDGGWGVVMHLMQYERGMYSYASLTKALVGLGKLRADMTTRGASAEQRARFARTYLAVLGAQARCAATVRELAAETLVGPGSSVDKLLASHAEKAVNDLVMEVRRDWVVAGVGGDPDRLDGVRAEWWYSRAATIMGGTAEIQRGIVADHLLGLPKEKR
jgi:acyl-CoA dehydrogenase